MKKPMKTEPETLTHRRLPLFEDERVASNIEEKTRSADTMSETWK